MNLNEDFPEPTAESEMKQTLLDNESLKRSSQTLHVDDVVAQCGAFATTTAKFC